MRLTFVRESVDVVVPANSPTESLQPVAVSDVLTGAKMDIQPLAGDDFQSLLTVLPSIIRGPEGRLRIKGGAPTTGALQLSSASLNDPSTGDFDLELPSGAVESVEVLSNPFAAEYGRFSTSVTQVRTKRGTNDWIVKPDNLVPGFGKGFAFVNKFEPRLSISGPLKRDRLLFGEYLQYRFARTPVKSLPGEPQLGLDSFDSFTRLDAVLSSRHALTGGVIYFPRKITNATLSTFRPDRDDADVHPGGVLGRRGRSAHPVGPRGARIDGRGAHFRGRSEDAGRRCRWSTRRRRQSGNFFNRQERNVHSLQFVEALTVSKDQWLGQHVFKFGLDLQHSSFDGDNYSQEVDVVRLDGSLAERTTFSPRSTNPEVSGTEFAVFAQDRWRVNDRLNFELGFRADRDDVVERVNYSPRVGMSVSVLPEGRGDPSRRFREIRRADAADRRRLHAVRRADRQPVRRRRHAARRRRSPSRTSSVARSRRPESIVQTVAWDQRFGRRVLLQDGLSASQRLARVHRRSRSRAHGLLTLVVDGRVQVLGTRDDGTVSSPASTAISACRTCDRTAPRDLNDYDQFFGNFRNPIIRSNENAPQPDRRAQPTDRARHDRPAGQVGLHRRSTSGARASRGRR